MVEAPSLRFSGCLRVTLSSVLDGLVVEAVMLHKVGILAGDNGHRQEGRDLVERHPMVIQSQFLALTNLLRQTYEHQRREVDRQKRAPPPQE